MQLETKNRKCGETVLQHDGQLTVGMYVLALTCFRAIIIAVEKQ